MISCAFERVAKAQRATGQLLSELMPGVKWRIKPLPRPCRARNEKLPQIVGNPHAVWFSSEAAPALLFPLDTNRLQWKHKIWLKVLRAPSSHWIYLRGGEEGWTRSQIHHIADTTKKQHCRPLRGLVREPSPARTAPLRSLSAKGSQATAGHGSAPQPTGGL